MDYNNIPPKFIKCVVCPFCGSDSAHTELRYGYPSPRYWKGSRGFIHANLFPSVNEFLVCLYCGEEAPSEDGEIRCEC